MALLDSQGYPSTFCLIKYKLDIHIFVPINCLFSLRFLNKSDLLVRKNGYILIIMKMFIILKSYSMSLYKNDLHILLRKTLRSYQN